MEVSNEEELEVCSLEQRRPTSNGELLRPDGSPCFLSTVGGRHKRIPREETLLAWTGSSDGETFDDGGLGVPTGKGRMTKTTGRGVDVEFEQQRGVMDEREGIDGHGRMGRWSTRRNSEASTSSPFRSPQLWMSGGDWSRRSGVRMKMRRKVAERKRRKVLGAEWSKRRRRERTRGGW